MTTESKIPAIDPEALCAPTVAKPMNKRLSFFDTHKEKYLGAYGALDGLNNAYSTTRCVFDFHFSASSISSPDAMHDWMLTPEGIGIVALESIALTVVSTLANAFDDDNENALKRSFAIHWRYVRDALKAFKNSYKGLRGAMQIAGTFSGIDLRSLIIPIGIEFCALGIINRLWLRNMFAARKAKKAANISLYNRIKFLDPGKYQTFLEEIERQTTTERYYSYLAVMFNALIDSLYLYMGAMSVVALDPTTYLFITVLCSIYALTCIVTRLYEEHDYQRQLLETQYKIEWKICSKELILLLQAQFEGADNACEIHNKIKTFEIKRDAYFAYEKTTLVSAAFNGLINGLAVYGVMSSIMFSASTISTVFLVSFPPALVIIPVFLGLVCLMGFMAHSIITQYPHISQQAKRHAEALKQWSDVLTQGINAADIKSVMSSSSSPKNSIREWAEVGRSFGSGIGKGPKSSDFVLNPLKEIGADGHYQLTTPMLIIALVSSVAYSIILAIRGYIRGFCRTKPGCSADTDISHSPPPPALPHPRKSTDIRFFPRPRPESELPTSLNPVSTDNLAKTDESQSPGWMDMS